MESSDTKSPDRFVVRHDFEEDGELEHTILRSVAAVEGVRPEDLEGQFHSAVDSDALDRLFRPNEQRKSAGDRRAVFWLGDYEVTVQNDDPVSIFIAGE